MRPPGETSVTSAQRRARTSPTRRVSTTIRIPLLIPVADEELPQADEVAEPDDKGLGRRERKKAAHQGLRRSPFVAEEDRSARPRRSLDLAQGGSGRRADEDDARESKEK